MQSATILPSTSVVARLGFPCTPLQNCSYKTYLLYAQNKAAKISFICVSRKHFYCKRLCIIMLNTKVAEQRNPVLTDSDKNTHSFSAMETLNAFAVRHPVTCSTDSTVCCRTTTRAPLAISVSFLARQAQKC